MLDEDTTALYAFFETAIDSFVPGLVYNMQDRQTEWGKLDSMHVEATHAVYIPSAKGDTVRVTVEVTTQYAYNHFQDILYLQRVGKSKPMLTDYSLGRFTVMDCSRDELDRVSPVFFQMTKDLVAHRDEKVKKWFGSDPAFMKNSFETRDRFFPLDMIANAEVKYHRGYMRKYCGTRNRANAFLTYEVMLNDTTVNYVTLLIYKNTDEDEYDLYSFYAGNEDGHNKTADLKMAEQLTNEIFRMLERNDYKAFYYALHDEAKPTKEGQPYTEEDMKEMVDEYASWGKFDAFYDMETLRLVNIGDASNVFIRYVVIAQLLNEEGETEYVELSFKPDATGKIRLMGFEYM